MAASSKIKWVELIIIWFNLDKKITLHKNSATFFSYLETSFCTLSLGKDSTQFSLVIFCRLFAPLLTNIWSCENAQWFLGSESVWIKVPKRTNYKKITSCTIDKYLKSRECTVLCDWWGPCLYLSQETMNPFCLLSIEIPVIICHLFHFTFHFAFTQPLGPLCFQVRLPILAFAFNSNFTSGAAPLLGSELCSNQNAKKTSSYKK